MVVGIRQTSSAMSTVGEKSTPENLPKGSSVMQTSRKMIVSAESRMVSAISLGVFWRFAPSTRPIMRSRKLSPGLAEMRTLISSLSTRVPPVTLERSPPASRMTGRALAGDGAFVHGGRALDDLAVAGDGLAGDDEHHVALAELVGGDLFGLAVVAQAVGGGLGAAGAQGVGLRLAAALGHRLGEVGEEHREPQPDADLAGERLALVRGEDFHGGHERADLRDEHHGVSHHRDGVEFLEGVPDGGDDDLGIEDGTGLSSHEKERLKE